MSITLYLLLRTDVSIVSTFRTHTHTHKQTHSQLFDIDDFNGILSLEKFGSESLSAMTWMIVESEDHTRAHGTAKYFKDT